MKTKKGFTLIEMLVVIAIIAVLVSVIIPVVGKSTVKAQAATDAANLRAVMGQLNGMLVYANAMNAQEAQGLMTPKSVCFPDARLLVVYANPGFIDAYYMHEGQYYGLTYFSELAEKGSTDASTAKPEGANYEWYEAGVGAFTE